MVQDRVAAASEGITLSQETLSYDAESSRPFKVLMVPNRAFRYVPETSTKPSVAGAKSSAQNSLLTHSPSGRLLESSYEHFTATTQ